MSTFGSNTITDRAVADPRTDHVLPNPRALSWELIATPVALRGVEGQHCQLVHGDYWREIKGNQILEIERDQNITIEGKHKETIGQDCYQNIVGPHLVTNHSVRNELALGRWIRIYGSSCRNESQEGIYRHSPYHIERFDRNEQHHSTDINLFGFSLFTYVLQIQLSAVQAVAGLIDASATAVTAEVELGHAEFHAGHYEMHLVHLEP